jgi:hypothetical protein
MNSSLPFVPRGAKARGMARAFTHLVIHSFVNVGSPTTLSSPVYAGICALSLVAGIWPSWPGNLASASPRARFYDGRGLPGKSEEEVRRLEAKYIREWFDIKGIPGDEWKEQ